MWFIKSNLKTVVVYFVQYGGWQMLQISVHWQLYGRCSARLVPHYLHYVALVRVTSIYRKQQVATRIIHLQPVWKYEEKKGYQLTIKIGICTTGIIHLLSTVWGNIAQWLAIIIVSLTRYQNMLVRRDFKPHQILQVVSIIYPHCSVLVGSRNSFEQDFTITLK